MAGDQGQHDRDGEDALLAAIANSTILRGIPTIYSYTTDCWITCGRRTAGVRTRSGAGGLRRPVRADEEGQVAAAGRLGRETCRERGGRGTRIEVIGCARRAGLPLVITTNMTDASWRGHRTGSWVAGQAGASPVVEMRADQVPRLEARPGAGGSSRGMSRALSEDRPRAKEGGPERPEKEGGARVMQGDFVPRCGRRRSGGDTERRRRGGAGRGVGAPWAGGVGRGSVAGA